MRNLIAAAVAAAAVLCVGAGPSGAVPQPCVQGALLNFGSVSASAAGLTATGTVSGWSVCGEQYTVEWYHSVNGGAFLFGGPSYTGANGDTVRFGVYVGSPSNGPEAWWAQSNIVSLSSGGCQVNCGGGGGGGPVPVASLTVLNDPVAAGSSGTLAWSGTNSTQSCTINGVTLQGASGTYNTSALYQDTVYNETCSNANGPSAQVSATVHVQNTCATQLCPELGGPDFVGSTPDLESDVDTVSGTGLPLKSRCVAYPTILANGRPAPAVLYVSSRSGNSIVSPRYFIDCEGFDAPLSINFTQCFVRNGTPVASTCQTVFFQPAPFFPITRIIYGLSHVCANTLPAASWALQATMLITWTQGGPTNTGRVSAAQPLPCSA